MAKTKFTFSIVGLSHRLYRGSEVTVGSAVQLQKNVKGYICSGRVKWNTFWPWPIWNCTFTPVGAQMEPPLRKHFSTGILQWNLHHYVRTIKITILQKKIENVVPFQNGGQITDFYFSHHFDFGQNLRKHFSKRIFQWNSAQSRKTWINLHYWNNIF